MTQKQLCEILEEKLKAIHPTHSFHHVSLESKEYSRVYEYAKPDYKLIGSTYLSDEKLTAEEIEANEVWIYITGSSLKDVIQKFCVELLLGKEKINKLQLDLSNKEIKELIK